MRAEQYFLKKIEKYRTEETTPRPATETRQATEGGRPKNEALVARIDSLHSEPFDQFLWMTQMTFLIRDGGKSGCAEIVMRRSSRSPDCTNCGCPLKASSFRSERLS
jgi:hypothetical protein